MISEVRQDWYFTFGVGTINAGRYVIVYDSTYGEARNVMFKVFGSTWAFQYASAEEAGVDKYNLTVLAGLKKVES